MEKCNAAPYKLSYMLEKGLELFRHKCIMNFCTLVHHRVQLSSAPVHAAGALFIFFLPQTAWVRHCTKTTYQPTFWSLTIIFQQIIFHSWLQEAQSPVYNILLRWRIPDNLWFRKCCQTAICCKCGTLWQTTRRPSSLHCDHALQRVCPQPWRKKNCQHVLQASPVQIFTDHLVEHCYLHNTLLAKPQKRVRARLCVKTHFDVLTRYHSTKSAIFTLVYVS